MKKLKAPGGFRRLGAVTLAAAAVTLAGALPAQAGGITRTDRPVAVDGTWVDGIEYNANLDLGRSWSKPRLIIDQRGGWKFSGTVYAGGALYRNLQTSCTITYGPLQEKFTVQTARYKVRNYKDWNWNREWDRRIQERWDWFKYQSSISCRVDQG